jgi:hypothetical protein
MDITWLSGRSQGTTGLGAVDRAGDVVAEDAGDLWSNPVAAGSVIALRRIGTFACSVARRLRCDTEISGFAAGQLLNGGCRTRSVLVS